MSITLVHVHAALNFTHSTYSYYRLFLQMDKQQIYSNQLDLYEKQKKTSTTTLTHKHHWNLEFSLI